MRAPGDFTIELDELDDIVGDLAACERDLAMTVSDLDRRLASLHGTWRGLTATAQREAHAEWSRGMTGMHAALAELRAAARLAHHNYGSAANTNVEMWRRVS